VGKKIDMTGRLLAALMLAALGVATPAEAAEDSAEASAVIVTRLSFFNTDPLDFGIIIPSNAQGFVTIAANGTVTSTNGIVTVPNTQSRAAFAGQGTFNQIVAISLGSNTIQLTGPGANMRVDQFVVNSTPTAQTLSTVPRTFRIGSPSGVFNFAIGGRLRVGANQRRGTYTGTFRVNLEYL
jgi:hypothetical protein